ncbi:MAG: dTMP kinase, partial [ANME-2 cluster archaeon]
MSGIHLVCEGADGTGKSSVVKIINDYLSDMGYNTTCHGNPGGTPLGKELRTLIKNRPDLN